MTLTGLVQNYSGLLAARFFLGKRRSSRFPVQTLTLNLGLTEAGLCMYSCSHNLASLFLN